MAARGDVTSPGERLSYMYSGVGTGGTENTIHETDFSMYGHNGE